jgi:DsbC/DsbD-like thiol-disulfide interchange protein
MNNFLLPLYLLFISFASFGQQKNPLTWSATYKSISATEGEIIITALIEKGWHTYSQRPTDAGPISTIISFQASKQFSLVGKTEESNAHEEFDKAFEAMLFTFTDKAEFNQKIKFTKAGFTIPFKVEAVCCNESMCLPPKTTELSVKIQ